MIALITLLLALPLGYLLASRVTAMTVYAVAYLWTFTFQTLYLLLDMLGGAAAPAFSPGEFPWSYGLVTLTVLLVGLGLVALGHRLAVSRRRGRGQSNSGRSSATGTRGAASTGKTAPRAKVAAYPRWVTARPATGGTQAAARN